MREVSGAQLHVHVGGADTDTLSPGRHEAALELVAGYERALTKLHPDDVAARGWYSARLADARTIAGLPCVERLLPEQEQRFAAPG